MTEDARNVEKGIQPFKQALLNVHTSDSQDLLITFDLPLVPPVDERGEKKVIDQKVDDHRIVIWYENMRLRISIIHQPTDDIAPKHLQIPLFYNPLDPKQGGGSS